MNIHKIKNNIKFLKKKLCHNKVCLYKNKIQGLKAKEAKIESDLWDSGLFISLILICIATAIYGQVMRL